MLPTPSESTGIGGTLAERRVAEIKSGGFSRFDSCVGSAARPPATWYRFPVQDCGSTLPPHSSPHDHVLPETGYQCICRDIQSSLLSQHRNISRDRAETGILDRICLLSTVRDHSQACGTRLSHSMDHPRISCESCPIPQRVPGFTPSIDACQVLCQ